MIRDSGEEDQLAIKLENLGREDTNKVGGKSANLGELIDLGVPVPPGFTTTSKAYRKFLEESDITKYIERKLSDIEGDYTVEKLQKKSSQIRDKILESEIPEELERSIETKYLELQKKTGQSDPKVAVRSSATAEDLPDASFAGQQDTFLNMSGEKEVKKAVRKCIASLFTARAISYRRENGFSHMEVDLCCTVQLMANPERNASGVMFTVDPDTGFDRVVRIEASYGLGELVVAGEVNPDSYTVHKQKKCVVEREKGSKKKRMVSEDGENKVEKVPREKREEYALTKNEITELAEYAKKIESHYQRPMDIEWVYDSKQEKFFIVQARPETVHSSNSNEIETFRMEEEGPVIADGCAVGNGIGSGKVRRLEEPSEMDLFEKGDVLVTERTDPDWEPVMKKASAIVTEKGGRTSHAAIVSRELGVPAVVGAEKSAKNLEDGQYVTVDCSSSEGRVMKGDLDFSISREKLDAVPETNTDVMLIIGNPSRAFNYAQLPVDGVGLAREEFIISSHIGKHPLKMIEDGEQDEFTETLSEGIAKIAAAFYPRKVILRLSDFKSDEYADLIGGEEYEPEESNPMLGFRGASRYYDKEFSEAFELECEAIRKVIEDKGLDNLTVMVPFCRTPEEAEMVRKEMTSNGLDTEKVETYLMAELPSNIKMAREFGQTVDGFSIGSNDLTQLALGVDRNSEKLQHLFQEDHPAVKRLIRELIKKADRADCKTSICGDAPSSIEGYVDFLISEGIDSISVSPDVALETILKVEDAERKTVQNYVRDGPPTSSYSS